MTRCSIMKQGLNAVDRRVVGWLTGRSPSELELDCIFKATGCADRQSGTPGSRRSALGLAAQICSEVSCFRSAQSLDADGESMALLDER